MKKLNIFLLSAAFFATTLFFSCASSKSVQKEPNFTENEQDAPNNTEQNDAINTADSYAEDDLSDLEEPVEKEELEELPEPVVQKEEKIETEPTSIQEPEVQDVPPAAPRTNETSKQDAADSNANEPSTILQNDTALGEQAYSQNGTTLDDQADSQNGDITDETQQDSQNTESNVQTGLSYADENSERLINPESDEEADATTDENSAQEEELTTTPSRSVTMLKNQTIDILYPGKGWIYQGNINSEGETDTRNRNFIFGGRKLGGKDQEFTLRSRVPGTFLLHFFKSDTLTGKYIDDYIEVTVLEKPYTGTEHITAPAYAEVVPPKATITAESVKAAKKLSEAQKNEQKDDAKPSSQALQKATAEEQKPKSEQQASVKTVSEIDTIIQTSDSSDSKEKAEQTAKNATAESTATSKAAQNMQNQKSTVQTEQTTAPAERLTGSALLERAQKSYSEKQYTAALTDVNTYLNGTNARRDEALYLKGQILEAKSSVQNIKGAIESYDTIVSQYPASALWENASKRSIFLKRFYINIR